jgi:hypothetical protein
MPKHAQRCAGQLASAVLGLRQVEATEGFQIIDAKGLMLALVYYRLESGLTKERHAGSRLTWPSCPSCSGHPGEITN